MEQKKVSQSLPSNCKMHLLQISQQEIDEFLQQISSITFHSQQYDNLLKQWIQYSQERTKKVAEAQQIVQAYKKDQKNVKINSTCLVCYGELPDNKSWCRMCGMECCAKCLGRLRVFPHDNNNLLAQSQTVGLPCCQKCDDKYLQSRLIMEDERQIQIRRLGFNRLKNIYQQLDEVNSNQRQHSQRQHSQYSPQKVEKPSRKIYDTKKKIQSLNMINHNLKLQTQQLKNKISWGEDVKKKLSNKYKSIQRKLSISESTIMEGCQTTSLPNAYDSDSQSNLQNLNQSVVESVIEDETRLIVDKNQCCACAIM